MKKNLFETIEPYELDSIDNIEMKNSLVLVEVEPEKVKKTVGGILVEGAETHNWAGHSIREGVVVKVPDRIVCIEGNENTMQWECDIEIEEGDSVWFDVKESRNAWQFEYQGRQFKSIRYDGIILKRDKKNRVVMCNGNILLRKVNKSESDLAPTAKQDKTRGIIHAIGKPVIRWRIEENSGELRTDTGYEELETGQEVYIKKPQYIWDLEDYAHAVFDNREIYMVAKRHMIGGIYK